MIKPDDLITFLEEARSIADIPALICNCLKASHCVIWKPSNTIQPGKALPELSLCRLFPFTSTFQVREGVRHSGIPADLVNDTTGRFYRAHFECCLIKAECSIGRISHDFVTTDVHSTSRSFMKAQHIQQVCFAPFKVAIDQAPWAICIYRPASESSLSKWKRKLAKILGLPVANEELQSFTADDAIRLTYYARLLPALISRLIDEDIQPHIQKISTRLSLPTGQTNSQINDEILTEVACNLAESLHCLEVSIILADDPGSKSPDYELKACTLDEEMQRRPGFRKTYNAERSGGLTSYSLAKGETLDFHDLRNFRDDKLRECFEERHPGIIWRDSCLIREVFASRYPDLPEENWPPVSFLCVPIISGSGVIGVIRCSHGTNPYFFTIAQAASLRIVADIVARWWMDRLVAMEIQARADLFKGMLAVQDGLRKEITAAFEADSPDPGQLVGNAVGVIFEKIHGVQHVSYRRFADSSREELVLVNMKGQNVLPYPVGSKFPISTCIARQILSADDPNDALWQCDLSWQDSSIGDTASAEHGLLSTYTNWLFVRVRFKQQVLGLLDFGFADLPVEGDWATQFQDVAVNLAKQLAIYEDLCVKNTQLRLALDEKKVMAADQILMTKAVGHQIKSPLANAVDILDALDSVQRKGKDSREAAWAAHEKFTRTAMLRLPALKGCLSKAQTVGRSMELFEALSEGRDPDLRTSRWSVGQLKRRAGEIANNNQAVELASDSPVIWEKDFANEPAEGGASTTNNPLDLQILLSRDTVDQVLDAVFGNAYKYGKAGMPIAVSGERQSESYTMTIANHADNGKELTDDDVKHCCEKRWRSDRLRHIPGSGLGLWIASELLRLQGGKLIPVVTVNGVTKFQLNFKLAGNSLRNTKSIPLPNR